MIHLPISLSPSGGFRLHFESHFVDFPMSEKGLECLHFVLLSHKLAAEKIGSNSRPTQSMINSWLSSMEEGSALQLAGQEKRWEDIEKRTGVKVRKFNAKGQETNVTLEDLDL